MDATPTPDLRRAIVRARVAVSAIFTVLGAGTGVWAVHIPIVKERLAIDPSVLGLALLILAIGAVGGMPLTGIAIARLGSRLPTAVLAIAYPILTPIAILSGSTPLLFVSLFFFGAALGSLDVAMNTQAAEIERAGGRPMMSSFHGFYSLGALAGSAVGGVLIGLGLADGSAGLLVSIVLLAASLVAIFHLWRSDPSPEKGPRFGLPSPAVLGLGFIAFLGFAAEGAVTDWSALFLSTVKHLSVAAAASGFAAFSVAMVVCRLTGDLVVARLGGFLTVLGGGLLAAAGMVIAIASPWPALSAAAFALVGVGAANLVPVVFSAAARTPGVPPSIGVAAVTTLGYSGFLIFPPVLGFIAKDWGLSTALAVVALMGLTIAAMAGAVRRQRP
jgi:predicted MFS family arabinose efflux permease